MNRLTKRITMALKRKYKSLEEIPADLRSLYTEANGEFVLEVEGTVAVEDYQRARTDLESVTAQSQRLQRDLHQARTEEAAVLEARRLGIRPTAETDLRNRARSELVLDAEGRTARRGTDGKTTPVAVSDWVMEQAKDGPHLFDEGVGTGAAGVRVKGETYTGTNPWDKDVDNWTEQGKLEKSNPELAAALKKSAKR